MGDQKEVLGKALESVLMDFLKEVKDTNMEDLKAYAKQVAADAIDVAAYGHTRAPQELLAHMLLIAEISRIRLTAKVKAQLVAGIQTAVGILVNVL